MKTLKEALFSRKNIKKTKRYYKIDDIINNNISLIVINYDLEDIVLISALDWTYSALRNENGEWIYYEDPIDNVESELKALLKGTIKHNCMFIELYNITESDDLYNLLELFEKFNNSHLEITYIVENILNSVDYNEITIK